MTAQRHPRDKTTTPRRDYDRRDHDNTPPTNGINGDERPTGPPHPRRPRTLPMATTAQHDNNAMAPRHNATDVVFNNPAAVVGVDATDDDIPPLEAAPEQMEIDAPAVPSDDEMDTDDIPNIRMVVLDGIVMGPQHCEYDNCTNDLSNARGGSLRDIHRLVLGSQCLHQPEWQKHAKNSKRHNQAGVRRMLQRPGENNAWEPKHGSYT
ncbi:hypothetical protein K443DRAFT_13109 [Laccaria amethystina LaAM-08-1]|uniref:CxC6 like cysteine cluster associated with KDZ domain-containing protein n=1 Tax=Laccaria amethystina LaAM-08-1 TaxID=1095629 RepID=A0A0C9X643_9AGAR|nr:hypothetical protein K443DRAFT_13109 [Laccaria amethystina LaAM-08-1]